MGIKHRWAVAALRAHLAGHSALTHTAPGTGGTLPAERWNRRGPASALCQPSAKLLSVCCLLLEPEREHMPPWGQNVVVSSAASSYRARGVHLQPAPLGALAGYWCREGGSGRHVGPSCHGRELPLWSFPSSSLAGENWEPLASGTSCEVSGEQISASGPWPTAQ